MTPTYFALLKLTKRLLHKGFLHQQLLPKSLYEQREGLRMLHTMQITVSLPDEKQYNDIAKRLQLPVQRGKHSTEKYSHHGFREITMIHQIYRPGMVYRGIEIILNPKVMLHPDMLIQSITADEVPLIADVFDEKLQLIFGGYHRYLPSFNHWICKRIDYCADVITEHVSDYIRLFQRSKIPNRHFEAKNKFEGSAYAICSSMILNFYNKQDELMKRRMKNTRITEEHVRAAEGMLRIEVQCERNKTNYIKQREGFSNKWIEHFLNPQLAQSIILNYYDKSIGSGDFYSLYEARKIINRSEIPQNSKQSLLSTLDLISQARKVDTARKQFMEGIVLEGKGRFQGSGVTFDRNVKKLRSLGINPVTIPRSWGIHHLPNIRPLIIGSFCGNANHMIELEHSSSLQTE